MQRRVAVGPGRLVDNFLVGIEPLVLKSKDNIKGTAMVTLSLYDAWGLADTHELTVTVDTKEDEEGNLLASFWWVIIIMIVIVVALYLAQDKWRPKKGAELEVAIEEETE